MSFRWQWFGSNDQADQSGTATFWFSEQMVEVKLPSSSLAHILAAAINRELKEARLMGAAEAIDAIRQEISRIAGDTR